MCHFGARVTRKALVPIITDGVGGGERVKLVCMLFFVKRNLSSPKKTNERR